ncbi:hypothetical protein [Faecalibacterium prausnitzii]|jgi:hypothetical protein|uniref:hypothetical protein n=1 Tax=Faecalibacterium prausnitzii TaxID=853 RepID=UPI0037BE344D
MDALCVQKCPSADGAQSCQGGFIHLFCGLAVHLRTPFRRYIKTPSVVPLERRLEKVLYGFSYAVTDQTLKINTEKKVISLNLQIDTDICSMYEYFEIFLQRMLMCRGAADMLGATFKLTANGAKVL